MAGVPSRAESACASRVRLRVVSRPDGVDSGNPHAAAAPIFAIGMALASGVRVMGRRQETTHLVSQMRALAEETRQLIGQANELRREAREVMRASELSREAVRRIAATVDRRRP